MPDEPHDTEFMHHRSQMIFDASAPCHEKSPRIQTRRMPVTEPNQPPLDGFDMGVNLPTPFV